MAIFFTQENFVLASPLIAVCTIYSFFKFIPLKYGVPFLGTLALVIKVRSKIIENRSTDEHIDRTIVQDLVSDEDAIQAQQEAKALKKQRKADEKLRQRLKAERKAAANNSGGDGGEEDDEAEITAFAKGSRGKGKKKN
mmetsp:Transcript_13751/g.28043  ORF Transcript_13751/g.28043 Transcript_13751/m.28043 type:complete len:139 (+) Transcript_13751:123-539(+)|eukprot:CAMPEP_0171328382 /NCGR_PEP_ID=MMETSP0878-20121228/619_1 /TAXON_ID=67004 /ORGANISM="Thalassiosira weissflogii, Strain CCMP1336" /LENGTH=138 /DNA_ID=CAMNT_0011828231 /DNA_START=106 /DNA_END=522 /DNA_ORIENTATION=+